MAGFEDLGALFAGNETGNSLAYAKGASLGASTQAALAQARERVQKNAALDELGAKLTAAGIQAPVADASSVALRAGGGLGDVFGMLGKQQEQGFRATAADPTSTPEAANIALRGVASGPVERYYSVGSRGYADKFAEGVQPLGEQFQDSGSVDGRVQLLNYVFGLDPNMQRTPENALNILRNYGRVFDVGGVPQAADLNPFGGGFSPAAAAPPMPSVPAGTTAVTPTSAAPAAPSVAPPVAQAPVAAARAPLAGVDEVASNTAAIARAKEIGQGSGEAFNALPAAVATLRNQTAQADLVAGTIDTALEEVADSWTATGLPGWVTRNIPGTPGYNLAELVKTIQANVGFQQLQAMRKESPTGGALGQVAVQELTFLQAALGNLNTAQNPEQMVTSLQQVRDHYLRYKTALQQDLTLAQQKAGTAPGAPAAGPAAPAAPETKVLGGRTYVKVNGQWMVDDGT
jgi:hypothetical protein